MNRWNIPPALERKIIRRDRRCVYCGLKFAARTSSRRNKPSWEHINNDEHDIRLANVARCCIACNASKTTKTIAQWLNSDYCRARGITRKTVAKVVRAALRADG